jgi:hypothetical protein
MASTAAALGVVVQVAETTVVEVQLPDGEVILAEVAVRGGDVGMLDRFKLDTAKATAVRVGQWAKETVLAGLPDKPDRFGIQVGINLVVRAGVLASVLASAATEASITISMEWDRTREPNG